MLLVKMFINQKVGGSSLLWIWADLPGTSDQWVMVEMILHVWVHLGCYNKKALDRLTDINYLLPVLDARKSRSGSQWGFGVLVRAILNSFSHGILTWWELPGNSLESVYKGTVIVIKAMHSWPNQFPKALPPKYIEH